MQNRGFSLIELIVGIVIVVLLLGLVLTIIPGIQDKGDSVVCVSKLRTISQVFHTRLADKEGFFPWYDKRQYGYNGLWWHQLYWYAGLSDQEFSELFCCPSDPEPRTVNMPGGRSVSLGYRYNRRLGYHDGTSWIYPQRHLASHPAPAKLPIIADGSTRIMDNAALFDEWVHVYKRHGRNPTYGNVLFLDGHVERIEDPGPTGTVPGDYDLKARLY